MGSNSTNVDKIKSTNLDFCLLRSVPAPAPRSIPSSSRLYTLPAPPASKFRIGSLYT